MALASKYISVTDICVKMYSVVEKELILLM
jgi:hypothetical protein